MKRVWQEIYTHISIFIPNYNTGIWFTHIYIEFIMKTPCRPNRFSKCQNHYSPVIRQHENRPGKESSRFDKSGQ